jgi:glycosyltransferase involved in cell wall biosynthesis
MLGRLSKQKGQDLLLESIGLLSEHHRSRLRIRIVGDSFGDAPINPLLEASLSRYKDIVALEPFQTDTSTLLKWADIVVVPSRRPESFGLVAAEAMATERAVIAAGHGGLLEIVQSGETGWIFEPNDARKLADCLSDAISRPDELVRRGSRGRELYEAKFTEENVSLAFLNALSALSGIERAKMEA